MKKFILLALSLVICLSFVACGNKEETGSTTNEDMQYLEFAPILGVEIKTDDSAAFYALTKNGEYTWKDMDANGEERTWIHEGAFCLDMKDTLCTFTREQTEENIVLKFTGKVVSYEIYRAEKTEIENDKKQIMNSKYLIDNNSGRITFPESGEYYYVVNVKYDQGDVPYGFLLAE